MQVEMLTNLGTRDAAELGLKCEDCQTGKTVEVSEDAAEKLLSNGWCTVVEIKATPKKPAIAKAKETKDSE